MKNNMELTNRKKFDDIIIYSATLYDGLSNKTTYVELQKGITAGFKFCRSDREVKLVSLEFDRSRFTPHSAKKYLKNNLIRFYDARFALRRRVPVAKEIYSIGNRRYVAVSNRNCGKMEIFQRQLESCAG